MVIGYGAMGDGDPGNVLRVESGAIEIVQL